MAAYGAGAASMGPVRSALIQINAPLRSGRMIAHRAEAIWEMPMGPRHKLLAAAFAAAAPRCGVRSATTTRCSASGARRGILALLVASALAACATPERHSAVPL